MAANITESRLPKELKEHANLIVVYLRRHDNRWSLSKLLTLGLILALREVAPKKTRSGYLFNATRCNTLMEKILKQS